MIPLSSFRESVSARIHALESARDLLQKREGEAVASIRRIAQTFEKDSEAEQYPELVKEARSLRESSQDEVQENLDKFIRFLYAIVQTSGVEKTHILIVDDDRMTCRMIEAKLQTENRHIHTALTAEDARRIIQKEPISIVLLDLMLPDIDGRTFLAELKENTATSAIPVVIITGKGTQPRAECHALGASALVEKPLNLEELSAITASVITNASQTLRDARKDSLTGLPNRAAFCEAFVHWKAFLMRQQQLLAVSLIDLDRFKSINDTYGHTIGDKVLCSFAQTVSKALRVSDVLARWGGEEFAVLHPGTNTPGADLAVKRALHLFREEAIPVKEGETVHSTFSAGVIEVTEDMSVQDAVTAADKLLYSAKSVGGNRVLSEAVQAKNLVQTVLLIEDDRQSAMLVKSILEKNGMEVVHCENGEEALTRLPQISCSLVLLDILMPKMNGLKVLQQMRTKPSLTNVPIVMLTGMDSEDVIEQAFEMGATDYITKPFSSNEFTSRIRHLMKTSLKT